jgi:hypothetical protein
MSIQVKSVDVYAVKKELKNCPLKVRQYVKALEESMDRKQELIDKCVGKIRELSK